MAIPESVLAVLAERKQGVLRRLITDQVDDTAHGKRLLSLVSHCHAQHTAAVDERSTMRSEQPCR
jgi:hypothetical protein